MDKNLRYWGEFRSKSGLLWRTEIWRKKQENEIWTVERLTFPYESPLEIEWSSTDKIEPLQSSSATLRIVSETDRKYLNLYTVDVGSVRLKVFREYEHEFILSAEPAPDESLYWSGTLNTELYEEPFSEKDNYEVSLTFSDLAILERIDFESSSRQLNVRELICKCLLATNIYAVSSLEEFAKKHLEEHISTQRNGQNVLTNDYLVEDNFIDEKGVPSTLLEVLEGILQPYALRLIQKNGKFILYDLDTMYKDYEDPSPVVWAGTDATLAMDATYNNVKLTFSPYDTTELLTTEIQAKSSVKSKYDKIDLAYGNATNPGDFSYLLEGFKFYYDCEGKGVEIGENASFFRMDPVNNGEECCGVLWSYLGGKYSSTDEKNTTWFPKDSNNHLYANVNFPDLSKENPEYPVLPVVFRTEPCYLSYSLTSSTKYLNLTLPFLFDARYNPFASSSNNNEKGNYEHLQGDFNFAYIPVDLELLDNNGKVLYHYTNVKNIMPSWTGSYIGKPGDCGWVRGKPSNCGTCWLSYYSSSEEHYDNTSFTGWTKNRQACYPTHNKLNAVYTKGNRSGEYIPTPPEKGFLRLTVYAGVSLWNVCNWSQESKGTVHTDGTGYFRWWAYQAPTISICDHTYNEPEDSDLEISAYVNKAAKEELDIDTIVGTIRYKEGGSDYKGMLFTARGVLRKASGEPTETYTRSGTTDCLENLLIGTVYSQYATRHLKLSGTIELLLEFGLYTDCSEPGRYLLLSEVQNLMEDESSITMVQLSEENYKGIEFFEED